MMQKMDWNEFEFTLIGYFEIKMSENVMDDLINECNDDEEITN